MPMLSAPVRQRRRRPSGATARTRGLRTSPEPNGVGRLGNRDPAWNAVATMSIFTENELAYLTSQRLGRMATAQPNGTLQVNPIGYRYNPETDTIDVGGFGMTTSQKFRNVNDNGRVAIVVDDVPSQDPVQVRFLEIRGVAETVGEIIRIHPRKIISFGVEEIDVPQKTRSHSRRVNVEAVTAR
jgi:pyridoxamine 5'-phosphate oxidase family protein